MGLSEYLKESTKEIQQQITTFLTSFTSDLQKVNVDLSELINLFALAAEGGKYIRGSLIILGYEVSGLTPDPYIYKVAAAYELLHTSLLIHDDIIDRSLTRRGKSTIHAVLGNNHYGISQALCIGDLGFFLTLKLIAQSNLQEMQILSILSQTVLNTIAGEMLDIKYSLPKKTRSERDVLVIQKLKTADYTVTGPLILGATLGNVDQKNIRAMSKFGEAIGTAFQIHDDILGVFGHEEYVGKSTRSDIEENKNTLLITHALQKANISQKALLKKYYGIQHLTTSQHETIKQIFVDTGSLAYSQKKAAFYLDQGKVLIPAITRNTRLQDLFREFADFVVVRKK